MKLVLSLEAVLLFIMSIGISVIGYFLKREIERGDKREERRIENDNELTKSIGLLSVKLMDLSKLFITKESVEDIRNKLNHLGEIISAVKMWMDRHDREHNGLNAVGKYVIDRNDREHEKVRG